MKKCKGAALANGYGCNSEIEHPFKFGLCKPCYADWLFHSIPGKRFFEKMTLKAKTEKNNKIAKIINPVPRKKYTKVEQMSYQELKIATQRACNDYIRLRDDVNYGICISSENKINDAGHFFSIGSNAALRYSPQNIHGQNRGDNYFKSGNLVEYEKGLRLRHGNAYMDELYELHAKTMQSKVLDKELVLRINKLYKYLAKKGIWVFTHLEFENLLNLMKL